MQLEWQVGGKTPPRFPRNVFQQEKQKYLEQKQEPTSVENLLSRRGPNGFLGHVEKTKFGTLYGVGIRGRIALCNKYGEVCGPWG